MTAPTYEVLPFDRWHSATDGLVREAIRQDTVFYTSLVDATALDELRRVFIVRGEGKPSYTALVIKAISLALADHPEMNRLVLGGLYRFRPVQLKTVDAVVAVERVRGGENTVYAGIVRATDLKSSGGISEELRKLSSEEEAEDPRLALFLRLVRWAPGWLCRLLVGLPRYGPKLWVEQRGGAFALTSVGKYGMDVNYAKWPWPLTFTMGEIKRRPVVAGDAVVARSSFHLSMGYDHRLANGGQAARFFHEIVQRLEAGNLGAGESGVVPSVPEKAAVQAVGLQAASAAPDKLSRPLRATRW
jgi:pyruvate/2-oxoglutarate dehydrogenase complex dihydrolipoamide acyltransferase (E2) component